jgi:hypothetical protein
MLSGVMRHANSPVLALALCIALLSACTDEGTPTVALPFDGSPLPVTLISQTSVPLDGLPRIAITGLVGEVEVVWDVDSPPCLSAHVSGQQNERELTIVISRSPDSLMSCIPSRVGNRYVLHAGSLTAGTYNVQVFDEEFGSPMRKAGQQSVVVSNPDFFFD